MAPYLATIVVLALISRNPDVDPYQHAGLDWQSAFLSRLLEFRVCATVFVPMVVFQH